MDHELRVPTPERGELGQTHDMIDMEVAEHQVRIDRLLFTAQLLAQRPKTRARIKDQSRRTAADLDTHRIAAIAEKVRAGRRKSSSHAPEGDPHDVKPPLAPDQPTCRERDLPR